MTTSIETKRQMKKWEGLRLFAYLDTGGVPTIGFGHTKGVRMGDAITLKQAEQYFEQDIALYTLIFYQSVYHNVGQKSLQT